MKKLNQKIKLMVVTPYFPPNVGGAQNYAYNIAVGIAKQFKWQVVVVTSNFVNKKIEIEQKQGIKIYRLPILFKFSNTPINPMWYFQIKKIIREENPDIINANAPVPFITDVAAAAAGNLPFVLTYHTGTMKKEKIIFDVIISFYEKLFLSRLFKRADRIICSSEFVKNTIAKSYSHKSVVITPAVDISLFKPTKKKKLMENTVLFVGRHANLYTTKGLYYLIDAIKKIPHATLQVVGEKIDIKEKNIKFLGIKRGADLVNIMQNSSILVLPSLPDKESFGMVLIEAMGCKIPVIGTRIGGIPEVINHGKDGLLVPAQDSEALKNAIEKILTKPALAKKMGENGYNKVRNNYTWSKKVSDTQNILISCLQN